MEKLKRVAYYIRVSTEEQKLHGLSLDAQRMKLDDYAAAHGLVFVAAYVDEGVSGRKPIKKRPELQRMLKDAEKRLFDLIIFIKLDRYFRSVAEYHECQKILDNCGVMWAATEEKYDLTTANGRAFVNMKLTIAELEADQTGERIRLVNDYKVREGYALTGALPFGFKLERKDGHSIVVKDPEKERIVYALIEHYEKFHNLSKTREYIAENFGICPVFKVWRTLLSNSLLYGEYRGNANYCEPYITRERFDRIQEILQERNVPHIEKRIYLFSRLVHCGNCGYSMCGSSTPRAHGEHLSYKCTGKLKGAINEPRRAKSEMRIEKYLLENLQDKLNEFVINAELQAKKKKQPRVNVERLEKEKEKLNYMFQKSRISVEVYDLEYAKIEKKLKQAAAINSRADMDKKDLTQIKKLMNTDIKEMYSLLDREHKQAFWQSIIKRITVTDGKIDFEIKADFLE